MQERRTAHESDTDCPEWNHYFEFYANDDPDGSIQLTVHDQDFTKVEMLGSVTVRFADIMRQVGYSLANLEGVHRHRFLQRLVFAPFSC